MSYLERKKTAEQKELISRQNEEFRRNLAPRHMIISGAVRRMIKGRTHDLAVAIASLKTDEASHDCGTVEWRGRRFAWSIACYDRDCLYSSQDPSDRDRTARRLIVITAKQAAANAQISASACSRQSA